MNHRLELSAKDALSDSYLNEVSTMLVNLHFVYEKSPKRLRQLRNLADIMEELFKNQIEPLEQDGHSTGHELLNPSCWAMV